MPRMLKFKLNRESREIAVNPDKVLYVCHYEHNASALHFSKDCFVRVQGALDEVIRRMDGAGDDMVASAEHVRPEAPVDVH